MLLSYSLTSATTEADFLFKTLKLLVLLRLISWQIYFFFLGDLFFLSLFSLWEEGQVSTKELEPVFPLPSACLQKLVASFAYRSPLPPLL